MSKVFVLDTQKQPLNQVHPGRARMLLTQGKAAVFKRYPFTIILKGVIEKPEVHPLRMKIDPGSQTTGIALVNDTTGEVVFAAELVHRGDAIKKALDQRRAVRRGRRQRRTRYRPPRFANRKRRVGWMAPSLESRVVNVLTWVKRLSGLCPIGAISLELVKFDLQQMENPEISGAEYQQGTLAGYEIRQYLLEKWDRACSYCGSKQVPLQVEHIQAKANGGTDRVSNLTLSCDSCNKAKGTQDIQVFLAEKPDLLAHLLAQAKAPLKDAAAVNTTRWALYEHLKQEGLPIECGSGGLTKFNRTQRNLPKAHWIDAACVGKSTPPKLQLAGVVPLLITATGHGSRQKCNVSEIGFPCSKPKGAKKVKGFQTGDMVKAVVATGTKQGIYVGRVLVRATGWFDICTRTGRVQGISHRFCTPVHRCDGYTYQKEAPYAQNTPPKPPHKERAIPPPDESRGYPGAVLVRKPRVSNRETRSRGQEGGDEHMTQHHPLTLNVNDQCATDAGHWQECVEEDQAPYRLVSPPQTTMYLQVLSYLEETTRNQKVPPKSQLHFGEVAIATVAICIRWGSYFAVLTNRDLPQWTAAFDPEVSCVGDGEMARINIEASAALASWIDLMRADRQRFRKLVKAAVQLLPFPIAQLDGATYYNRFRAFSAINSANGRRYLMEAFARDFGSEWLEREKARVLVNPTRALANGILNEHWRNGSGIEDIHAGGIAPPRPLTQRRLTKAQETLLLQETAELFVPTLRALYHVVGKPSEETWPEQALPYAIAFKPPMNWSLDEQTREVALPGAEPR